MSSRSATSARVLFQHDGHSIVRLGDEKSRSCSRFHCHTSLRMHTMRGGPKRGHKSHQLSGVYSACCSTTLRPGFPFLRIRGSYHVASFVMPRAQTLLCATSSDASGDAYPQVSSFDSLTFSAL